jgi:hypothetical protein
MPQYARLYDRLVANTAEPSWSGDCWNWTGQRDRWGYGRFNIWVDGRPKKLMAHVAMQVCLHSQPADTVEFFQTYLLLTASKTEVDHLCTNPRCVNPDHHELVTKSTNCLRRDQRRKQKTFACHFSVC